MTTYLMVLAKSEAQTASSVLLKKREKGGRGKQGAVPFSLTNTAMLDRILSIAL